MTKVVSVSQREMQNKTGMKKALGYSLPEEDTILVRKGLPKDLKKEVLAHEEEHMEKGEEGPFPWGAVIGGVASLFGAKKQSDAAKKAARVQSQAAEQQDKLAREQWEYNKSLQEPYVNAGKVALGALMDMTGLSLPAAAMRGAAVPAVQNAISRGRGVFGQAMKMPLYERTSPVARGFASQFIDGQRAANDPGLFRDRPIPRFAGGFMGMAAKYAVNELGPENVYSGGGYTRTSQPRTIQGGSGYVQPNAGSSLQPTARDASGAPIENPGGRPGGYAFQTDPGYNFRFDEGQRMLERSAAARGGLLSGGFGRKAIRYGQDYASNEYENVYNRIARIAGIGQTGAQGLGTQGIYSTGQRNQALSEGAQARASGYTARGNVWGNAIGSIGELPWDDWIPAIGGAIRGRGNEPSGPAY